MRSHICWEFPLLQGVAGLGGWRSELTVRGPLEKRHGNLDGVLDRGGSTKQGRGLGVGLKKGLILG